MNDPNFARSVVYLIDHNSGGTLGVVVNRLTAVDVPSVLDGWRSVVADPPGLFYGGPVAPDGVLAVGQRADRTLTIVDLDEHRPNDYVRVRFFHGYSGWGPRQLDGELDEAAWVVVDGDPDDVFDATPDTLWRRVLARQSGETAWLAHYPDDVNVN